MKLSEATQFLRSKGYLVEKQKHVLNQAAKSKDDEEKFPKFDNADIISVKTQKAIPKTDEPLGVPISILQNVDPDNLPFEILGVDDKLKLNGADMFTKLIIKLK